MANNLVKLIFDQFLEYVDRFSKKSCFEFEECDFDYRIRELAGHRLIDVVYVIEDKCGRRRDAIVTIDFTNICYEDLCTHIWINYLIKLAHEFIEEICPKKLVINCDKPRKCRKQPHCWEPIPCLTTTTIIKKQKHVEPEPDCEIIVENECECIPVCHRTKCQPKHCLIIKHQIEKPWKCGDYSVLVKEPHEKEHHFAMYKGNPDYNNHVWKKCCGN